MTLSAVDLKFVEGFLGDLRNISNEGRKKHSAVKEASETAIIRLRNLSLNGKDVRQSIVSHCLDLLQPILLAAESGNSKLVILGLQALQRLFAHETIADTSLPVVMSLMWTLMENHTEELKLIQTITIIITSSNILHGEYLAKSLVICLRMHFGKDPVVSNTAGAAIRQLVPLLFEKALEESRLDRNAAERPVFEPQRLGSNSVPASLGRCGADAYALLQDLCQIMNGEQQTWLIGMTEMTRVLALELIESILMGYRPLFDSKEFSYLLRERLCPLLIKLISPCVRHSRGGAQQPGSSSTGNSASDKPSFPVTVHLIRIVYVLLIAYCDLLRTESEIFYSLLMKFVDSDKVVWTKLLAMEVFFKLLTDPKMVLLISQTYCTKAASEGVFGDMVNTINNYILAVFVKPTSPSASPATPPSTPQQAGTQIFSPTFTYKDVSIQLVPLGKPTLLESRESEPPTATDSYGMSLAFSCLCFVSRTMMELQEALPPTGDENKVALQMLVQHSWCGMLSAVSTLLEASCDDSVTDSLLQICKVYVKAAGLVKMDIVREAFITALCKAAFPINYTIGIIKAASSRVASFRPDAAGLERKANGDTAAADSKNRNQIVAVGTPLSSSFPGAVMLTAKNITCLNTLLDITTALGDLLNNSWILVLASLQHLSWILGMNQIVPGSVNGLAKQRQRANESSQSTILTNVMMSDLPELTKRFDDVFRQTRLLTDTSLEHVVSALCKLSQDALETTAASRDPSLFAVAKMVDVCLVNMFRIDTWWTVVTQNLTEVAGNTNPVLREWGTDAITTLVKECLAYDFRPSLHSNHNLQNKILHPLLALSRIGWADVRLKQFNCINHIILSFAEKIPSCWRPIVEVIGAVNGIADDALIRAGFNCVQAVVSDHLTGISFDCVEQCAEAATRYGNQTLELNVSLTAIGLLWNIADHIFKNRHSFDVTQDRLLESMLTLYKHLSQLCLDIRPEVRKSAAQTLFLAIASHGNALDLPTWHRLIVDVCYTLLKCLEKYCMTASEERIGDEEDGKVVMHHSRDTAKKQWAETWAMVLPTVTKTVLGNLPVVVKLKQPQQAWQGILHHIQRGGISGLEEVSMSALKCLDDIILIGEGREQDKLPLDITVPMWDDVWKACHGVGVGLNDLMRRSPNIESLPSQKLITFYTIIYRRLNHQVRNNFTTEMFRKLQDVFPAIMLPVLNRNASKMMACRAEISPLQDSVLQIAESLQLEVLKPRSPSPHLITELFNLWLKYARHSTSHAVIARALAMEPEYLIRWWAATFSLFSETAMQRVVELYQQTHAWKLVMDSDTLSNIIQVGPENTKRKLHRQ
ncbi:Protein MON2-like protein [Hypsibius exemplaris]|uniref:Protein MON2 homolog n=1 Tax=Hypsibius exemplaris TaxID=2072580 RepID=A0A1W0X6U7_HYPEX|nr:Protein MON2-like protein [Hypsibius exemplaris]